MTAEVVLARDFVRAYPVAAARQLESASAGDVAELLSELGAETVAPLVCQMIPSVAARCLGVLKREEVAIILERLRPEEAALIVRVLSNETRCEFLEACSGRKRELIESLLNYRPDQVASRMDPRAPAVTGVESAGRALQVAYSSAEGAFSYVYVIDDAHRLIGVVSLHELILTSEKTPVASLMTESPERLRAADPLDSLLNHPGWLKAHALPVVDKGGVFIGVIRYSTLRALEGEFGASSAVPSGDTTVAALADVLWLGTTSVGRLAESVFLGNEPNQETKR